LFVISVVPTGCL